MTEKTLSDINWNQVGCVIKLHEDCEGFERFRLLDLGVVPGTKIKLALDNPLNDPLAYWIRGAIIALRKEQTDKVIVSIENE